MLSREQIVEHLRLQDQLNQLVHPNWLSQNFNWTRAVMVEATELLDHIGWKWWKAHKMDIDQTWLEMVDIWHFILSHELVLCSGDHETAADSLLEELKIIQEDHRRTALRLMNMRELTHELIGDAAFGNVSIDVFGLLMGKLTMTWEQLHSMYLAKNVLNIFRQRNGYQTGDYAKIWGKHGEDNQVLARLVEANPNITAEQLLAQLDSLYTEVLESAAA